RSANGAADSSVSLGQRPRVDGQETPALKARFTADVFRSIIGASLISPSGCNADMFEISNYPLVETRFQRLSCTAIQIPEAMPQACNDTPPLALDTCDARAVFLLRTLPNSVDRLA